MAPFLRYQYFDVEDEITLDEGTLSSFGGGVLIGRQWIFKERVSLDLFVGPSYFRMDVEVPEGSDDTFDLDAFDGFEIRAGITFGLVFRGPQLVNRVVDITETIDQKVESNRVIVTQGPGGNNGAQLKQKLAKQGKELPLLGKSDESANRNYIKHIVFDIDSQRLRGVPSDRETGKPYGLEWAELFHYIGPSESKLDAYVEEHAREK